jgi:hypothetical protein
MRYGAYFADIANGDKGTRFTSPWKVKTTIKTTISEQISISAV